jgi:glycosyltransferase involved in cell wall biosynthesis
MTQPIRYVVVTPARDEGRHIEKTILSMLAQTILPEEWIIVNDGSTDDTGVIADKYAQKHSWIKALHRKTEASGSREGVVEAFNAGYNALVTSKWDFMVKFDGDLSLPPIILSSASLFFDRTDARHWGGDVYHEIGGSLVLEKNPGSMFEAPRRSIEKACWNALEGLIQSPGWDTLDEVKANMLGWKTRCFPDLKLVHHKQTGSADGKWGPGSKTAEGAIFLVIILRS